MADDTERPDLCVIGGGAAGGALAASAAVAGFRVVLIERDADRGFRRGALAARALAAAARRAHAIRTGDAFGLAAADPQIDFERVRAHARRVADDLARNASALRLAALGVRVIRAEARFVGPDAVSAGDVRIAARWFVLATGSVPRVPAIAGLRDTPFLTPDRAFDAAAPPEHLAVIGAGSSGLEWAQLFRRSGSAVTVLEAETPLAEEDPECVALLLAALAGEGIDVRTGARVERVRGTRKSARVSFGGEALTASHVLVAAGWEPNLDALGLDAAGIERAPEGLVLGLDFRTTNRRVFAIGGAAGPCSTHAARQQARFLLRKLIVRLPQRALADSPRVVHTEPALAHVGLDEEQARAQYGSVRVLRSPYFENDRAILDRAGSGMVKLVATRWGRLVGATAVGAGAEEMMAFLSLAIRERLGVRELADLPVPYPTLAEIGQQAAWLGLAGGLTNRWVRRIIATMRRFR